MLHLDLAPCEVALNVKTYLLHWDCVAPENDVAPKPTQPKYRRLEFYFRRSIATLKEARLGGPRSTLRNRMLLWRTGCHKGVFMEVY